METLQQENGQDFGNVQFEICCSEKGTADSIFQTSERLKREKMLIPKKDIKAKVVGGVPQSYLNLAKDYDHDKVPNFADCQPYNKKEQGWTHKLGSKLAKKVGAERIAEHIKERGKAVDISRVAVREEKYKQMKETAVYREQERGRKERERIKNKPVGGWRSFQSFGKYVVKPTERKSGERKKKTIYVKKGKHYVKKTVYSKMKQPTQVSNQTNNKGFTERINNDEFGKRLSRMI